MLNLIDLTIMFGLQSLVVSQPCEVEAPRPVATPARPAHTEPMANASKPSKTHPAGSVKDAVQPQNADVAVPKEAEGNFVRSRRVRPVLSMSKTRQVT